MRKRFWCILIMLVAFSNGCVSEYAVPKKTEKSAYVYDLIEGDYPSLFRYSYESVVPEQMTVSDDGRIVITKLDLEEENVKLLELGMDGSERLIGKYDSYLPDAMGFMNNELYTAVVKYLEPGKPPEGMFIFRVDTETGERELYVDLNDVKIDRCGVLSGNENELFLIGDDLERKDMICRYEGYPNSKHLSVFRIFDGKAERLPVDFPTAVCAKRSGGAIIAACDENGYYVTTYENGKLSDNVYMDVADGWPIDAIADIDGEHVMFSTFTSSGSWMLCASSIGNMYKAELIEGMEILGERIFAAGGYCYYHTGLILPDESGNIDPNRHIIERIRFSDYYEYNEPINFICSEDSCSTPFGCGYMINVVKPSDEEVALKVLSQDKDYDMCYISTADDISYSLKKQGSFYPLNDVEGVKEYIDACFPSVKDAFTDDNGDIYGLPVFSDSLFIFSDCGDTDYSEMKLADFVDYIDGLSDDELMKTNYSAEDYTRAVLTDYISKHDSFDTSEFRLATEKLKASKRLNMSVDGSEHMCEITEKEHLMCMYFNEGLDVHMYNIDCKVSGIPAVSDPNILVPNVTFICVNPNSAHLDDTLNYIRKVVKHLGTQGNRFVQNSEEAFYYHDEDVQQMARLCSDARVCFTYPDELYLDDFREYLSGNTTLDSFIKEADRKLKTYLNE